MKVLTTPDKFLRLTAKKVDTFDKNLRVEIDDMIKTLREATNPEGVGLASTQVGIDKRIFIVTLNNKPEIFINPEIVATSEAMLSEVHPKKKERWLEGCLSIPHIWGFVDRPYWVEIKYTTPQGNEYIEKTQRFTDIESSYVQHENDHLNGVLFTDHILKQGGTIYKDTPDGLAPVDLV